MSLLFAAVLDQKTHTLHFWNHFWNRSWNRPISSTVNDPSRTLVLNNRFRVAFNNCLEEAKKKNSWITMGTDIKDLRENLSQILPSLDVFMKHLRQGPSLWQDIFIQIVRDLPRYLNWSRGPSCWALGLIVAGKNNGDTRYDLSCMQINLSPTTSSIITSIAWFLATTYVIISKPWLYHPCRRSSIGNKDVIPTATNPNAAMKIYASDPPTRLYCTDAATNEVTHAGPIAPDNENTVCAAACVRPSVFEDGDASVIKMYMQPNIVSCGISNRMTWS